MRCGPALLPAPTEKHAIHHAPISNQPHGRVYINLPMTPESLTEIYRFGAYPLQEDEDAQQNLLGYPVIVKPKKRALIRLDEGPIEEKIPEREFRRIKSALRRGEFRVTFNTRFSEVIYNCRNMGRRKEDDLGRVIFGKTWISALFVNAFKELHRLKLAHSYEVHADLPNGDEVLAAGGFLSCIDGVCVGESSFRHPAFMRSLADKVGRYVLLRELQAQGHHWLDVQTADAESIAAAWGAVEVDREVYDLERQLEASRGLTFVPPAP